MEVEDQREKRRNSSLNPQEYLAVGRLGRLAVRITQDGEVCPGVGPAVRTGNGEGRTLVEWSRVTLLMSP